VRFPSIGPTRRHRICHAKGQVAKWRFRPRRVLGPCYALRKPMQHSRILTVKLAFVVLITVPVPAFHGRTSASERSTCRSLEGTALLWSKTELRFVNVGEAHGANEVPRIFADLVCSAGITGRPIIVGLEMNSQIGLDAYFGAPDRATAEQRLLSSDEWKADGDGRTSKAMLALLADLAAFQRRGLVRKVVAISVSRMEGIEGTDQAALVKAVASGERRMAETLIQAAAESPDALVITLAGSFHASKRNGYPDVIPYEPMGAYLPAEHTVALMIDHLGGGNWGCDPQGCGPQPWKSNASLPRGVVLDRKPSHDLGFDGILAIGTRVTPSPPANGRKPFRHASGALIQQRPSE